MIDVQFLHGCKLPTIILVHQVGFWLVKASNYMGTESIPPIVAKQIKGSVKEPNKFRNYEKLRKSLVKPVVWQKTCNYIEFFSSSA